MTKITFRSDMTVELIQAMASDAMVANAARVSTLAEQSKAATDSPEGLINFLMKNRHGTPFEHNAFTFFIQAPIFVFREFMRHRIASYNEESGRYRQLEPVFYVPDEKRKLVQEGKPGHYTFVEGTPTQVGLTGASVSVAAEAAYRVYQNLLDNNIAREVARMVLPVNIYSSMYVTMNARSLMNFLSLRTIREGSTFPSYPQREIELVAEQMEGVFADLMPITYKTFNQNGRVSP